jgi:uncharacterized membrane protein
MSNRATRANWNRAKSRTDRARIAVGLVLLGLGSVLLIGALDGMYAHKFMFTTFDFRFGSIAIGQTIGLLVLGAALIMAGIAALFVRQ